MHEPVTMPERYARASELQALLPCLAVGRSVTSDMIDQLAAAMHALPDEVKVPIPVEHHFAHHLYVRRARFPAGSILVGETHNLSHLSVLLSGRMVTNVDGVMVEVEGPLDVIAQPGTRRVGVALTDVVWVTAHGGPPPTERIDDIEAWLVAPNPLSGRGMSVIREDRADYEAMAVESGFSPEEIRAQVENRLDQIDMPADWDGRLIAKESPIHGVGMFAAEDFRDGQVIAPARLAGMRTPAGRFINHSPRQNAKVWLDKQGDAWIVTTSQIPAGAEVLTNYRDTLALMQVPHGDQK